MGFAEYLEENILGPLQMTDSKFTAVAESNRYRFTKSYNYGPIPLEEANLGDYFQDNALLTAVSISLFDSTDCSIDFDCG